MYYGKKKIIIISSIVGGSLLLLILLGTFLFLGTDLFKSNETLFWKYAVNLATDKDSLSATQLSDVQKLKQIHPYTVKGTLNINNNVNGKKTSMGEVSVEEEADNLENYNHTKIDYKYNLESIFNLEFVSTLENKDQEESKSIYALKSDDVVTAYIGLRNDNLNVLSQKLDMSSGLIQNKSVQESIDSNSDIIPSDISLGNINLFELFNFNDNQLEHIYKTYSEVITKTIPESKYSKQTGAPIQVGDNNYKTTSYRLDLTGTELQSVLLNILNTAKTDNITLGLISKELYLLGYNGENTSEDSAKAILEAIINYVEGREFKDISIVVYNHDGKNIATEIIVKNDRKYTICSETNKFRIKYEDLVGESKNNTEAVISYNLTTTLSSITVNLKRNDSELAKLNISNTGSATQKNLSTKISLSIASGVNSTYDFDYSQELNFVDEVENKIKLDQTNCVILNDYNKEQLNNLLGLIVNRAKDVFTEKSQILSSKIQSGGSNVINISDQVKEAYNSRFEEYKGTITGSQLKTLKLNVEANNDSADTDNIISMYIDNTQVTEATNINTSANYDVQLEYGSNGFVSVIKATTV